MTNKEAIQWFEETAAGGKLLGDKVVQEASTMAIAALRKREERRWIPVTERLPEEHDCFFTSFYGTAKWQDGMFLKCSDTVLASVEYEDGKRRVKAIITKDGKWDFSKMYRASKVTHWMPLPEPPKGGNDHVETD